MYNINF